MKSPRFGGLDKPGTPGPKPPRPKTGGKPRPVPGGPAKPSTSS
jgi:hypothetical protein